MIAIVGTLLSSLAFRITYNKIHYNSHFPLMEHPPFEKKIGPDDGAIMIGLFPYFFVFLLLVPSSVLMFLVRVYDSKRRSNKWALLDLSLGMIAIILLGVISFYLSIFSAVFPFIGVPLSLTNCLTGDQNIPK